MDEPSPAPRVPREAESRYRQALVCLEQAQARRTEAVCQFLEAQALWKAAAACSIDRGASGNALLSDCPFDLSHPPPGPDLLDQAAADRDLAKAVYCTVLEQSHLVQRLLKQSRDAYQSAEEKLARLARENQAM